MTAKFYWPEVSCPQVHTYLTRYVGRPHRKIVKLQRDRGDANGIVTQLPVVSSPQFTTYHIDDDAPEESSSL